MSEPKMVSFKQLDDWGVLSEINHSLLHPLGLSLSYDPVTNVSQGCLVSESLQWVATDEQRKQDKKKFEQFLINRYYLLHDIIGIPEETINA